METCLRERYRYQLRDIATSDRVVKIAPRPSDDVLTMDTNKDRKPVIKRPNVLKKLNAENLQLIERGLLGDLPDRFKPNSVPVRGQSKELVVAKPTGLLSSCLPVIADSPPPTSEKVSSDEEGGSPLKKSFSFRDKFRIHLFGKEKTEKPKCKTIVEGVKIKDEIPNLPQVQEQQREPNHHPDPESKTIKRFWFFRNRDSLEKKTHSPIYTRSKSFEFLPRAVEEGEEKVRPKLTKNMSYAFGSSDTLDTASVDSLEYIANVYYDKIDNVCLKSIKELRDSEHNSMSSSTTSASSGLVVNIFKTESVQDLLDEFDKAVDMFSENYMSDCEPYTRTYKDMPVQEKRKSSSFNTLPSPKVMQITKPNRVSENFKTELNQILESKRVSEIVKTPRRGSVTDWFVLEDQNVPVIHNPTSDANKYRRPQKKPMQRVRRVSSTKYVSTKSKID